LILSSLGLGVSFSISDEYVQSDSYHIPLLGDIT